MSRMQSDGIFWRRSGESGLGTDFHIIGIKVVLTHMEVNEMVWGSYVRCERNRTWQKDLREHQPMNRSKRKRSIRRLQERVASCPGN